MEKAREVLKKVTICDYHWSGLVLIYYLVSLLSVSHQIINVSSQAPIIQALTQSAKSMSIRNMGNRWKPT